MNSMSLDFHKSDFTTWIYVIFYILGGILTSLSAQKHKKRGPVSYGIGKESHLKAALIVKQIERDNFTENVDGLGQTFGLAFRMGCLHSIPKHQGSTGLCSLLPAHVNLGT